MFPLCTDCLGTAYNAKGFMECPNCRNIEEGQWRFANGRFHAEDMIDDEEEEVEAEAEAEDDDPGFFSDLVIYVLVLN